MIGPCKAKPNHPVHFVPSGKRHCEHCDELVLCPHGSFVGSCSECGREACARGEHTRSVATATCVYCGTREYTESRPTDDARAQVWARVYAAQFDVSVHRAHCSDSGARHDARQSADAAVRDFDEHYLGRVPSTKGTL